MKRIVVVALLLAAACSKGTDRDADGKLSTSEVTTEASKLVLRPGE